MTDLESVEEDGHMIPGKKRPLWWTPAITAAFAVLDDFMSIVKKSLSQVNVGSVKCGRDIEREKALDQGYLEKPYMWGNSTNRDTSLNKVCCHDLMTYSNQVFKSNKRSPCVLKNLTVIVTGAYHQNTSLIIETVSEH